VGIPIEKNQTTRFETDEEIAATSRTDAAKEEDALYDAMFKKDMTDEEKAILIGRTLDTQMRKEEKALLSQGLAKGTGRTP
jgi:hypothetical protein